MEGKMTKSAIAVFTAAILANSPESFAQETVNIQEWEVPYESSRPRDPFAASETSVWFVGQKTGYLAHLNPETGDFMKVDLKDGSGPHNLIVGSDGVVWFAGNRTSLIGRFDPSTDAIIEIPMPEATARDPHTLIFDETQENIWFTVQGGNFIGRLNIASKAVDLIPSLTESSRPYGIKLAPDGSIWVALFGTHKLAHVDPETLEIEEVPTPREEARLRRLEVLDNGTVWYVDYAGGFLGMYDPVSMKFNEYALPQGEEARPYGMAQDSKGRLWMVATGGQPNMFVGFDPATEEFFSSTEVPSGGGTIRHMHFYEPAGEIWFGTDTNYVGRAVVVPPLPTNEDISG